MNDLKEIIDEGFKSIDSLSHDETSYKLQQAIQTTIQHLSEGTLRVASFDDHKWITHEWLKKAILLLFKTTKNTLMPGFNQFYDKVPLKFTQYDEKQLKDSEIRIVPPASVRHGAFIGKRSVLMPSYVNIGAFVDTGCMIDTWATVGSCAQIGKNVHISGGAGIGGILEPLNANPTIIEDDCFIGARSEIVEGVIVEKNSVISMGVFIGQSTPIYDVENDQILYGRVPSGSVVIPGSLPGKTNRYHRSAAIIIKRVDEQTRKKTTINELLRS
ncbi:MAG: 2,3,4,5-tetrahydropyridine-2,6-dicarboxylate N-succinyltransferase [Coxiellaceae bacterium]|nr:2,3,4,5-tetrahydropyridine-2,6-dicarboxylate N-succinyltransferase [Coxiellaceae bacterium]